MKKYITMLENRESEKKKKKKDGQQRQ